MIRPEDFKQLKAFARQDALLLSGVWISSFASVVAVPESIIGLLLALSTPFVASWCLLRFRNNVLDGVISFRRGFAYCFYLFTYASLIFALAQFIYFRWIDNGQFIAMLTDSVRTMEPIYEQNGLNASELYSTLEVMKGMSPVEWTFMLMMQNFIIGFILSIPIAVFCVHKDKTNQS